MSEEPHILVCYCSSREHQIVVQYDKEDNQVYCHIHLSNYDSFWKRLKNGFMYIFGYKSKYGHFDEFIFKPEHSDKLKEISDILSKIK